MSFGFEMLPIPPHSMPNFKLLIIPIRDEFSRLAFSSSTLYSSIGAMTTVYWILRDFLSLVLFPLPSRERARESGMKATEDYGSFNRIYRNAIHER